MRGGLSVLRGTTSIRSWRKLMECLVSFTSHARTLGSFPL
jgi:hypothetical protein